MGIKIKEALKEALDDRSTQVYATGISAFALALLVFLLALLFYFGMSVSAISLVQTPTTGATTTADTFDINNVTVSDDISQTYTAPDVLNESLYMNFSGFGISVPSDVSISSVKVIIEYQIDRHPVQGPQITNVRIRIYPGGDEYPVETPPDDLVDANITTQVLTTLDTPDKLANARVKFYAEGKDEGDQVWIDYVAINVTYHRRFNINITEPLNEQNTPGGSLINITANVTSTDIGSVNGATVVASVAGANENSSIPLAYDPTTELYKGNYTATNDGFDIITITANHSDYVTATNTTEISIGTNRIGIDYEGELGAEVGENLTVIAYVKNSSFGKITGALVTANIFGEDNMAIRLYDDCTHGDEVANDGNYTNRYLAEHHGIDEITIRAERWGLTSTTKTVIALIKGQPAIVRLGLNRQAILEDVWQNDSLSAKSHVNAAEVPAGPNWAYDLFNTEQTTIRAYALVLDNLGVALPGEQINFTLYYPNGSVFNKTTVTADSAGVAKYSFDMNGTVYNGSLSGSTAVNGTYTINAMDYENASVSLNRTFSFEQFGCKYCHLLGDGEETLGFTTSMYSPSSRDANSMMYIMHRYYETLAFNAAHEDAITNKDCTYCHIGYGTPTTVAPGATGGSFTTVSQYPYGLHNNKVECIGCHPKANEPGNVTQIKECYDATCHPTNSTNVTSISTQDDEGKAVYTDTFPATGSPKAVHTAEETISCIVCHGTSHNVTKAVIEGTTNEYTEDSQCLECHPGRSRHSNESIGGAVNCTICHGQDIHSGEWFDEEGNLTSDSTKAGDCRTCHEKGLFDYIKDTVSQVPSYAGAENPTIPEPTNHSDRDIDGDGVIDAGQIWGDYWETSHQQCIYCHSLSFHEEEGLGRIAHFMGSNIRGGNANSTSFWCASCHYANYTSGSHDYMDMVTTFNASNFSIPPEITGNFTYYDVSNAMYPPDYVNHTVFPAIDDYSDDECVACHYKGAPQSITTFNHDIQPYGGGPNCTTCHALYDEASSPIAIKGLEFVDIKSMNNTDNNYTHYNLNNGSGAESAVAAGVPDPNITAWCWACHGNDTDSDGNANYSEQPLVGHAPNYKDENVRTCTDCHNNTGADNFNATQPKTHVWYDTGIGAQNITTPAISYCTADCHAVDEMEFHSDDPDKDNDNASASHYEIIRYDLYAMKDVNDSGTVEYCYYCHQNATTVFGPFEEEMNKYRSDHNPTPLTPNCTVTQCHGNATQNVVNHLNLRNPKSWQLFNDTNCLVVGCHYAKENTHDGVVNCTDCHMSDVLGNIHPIKYFQHDGKTLVSQQTGADCGDCHTKNESGVYDWLTERNLEPKKLNLSHSESLWAGAKWSRTGEKAYWNATPEDYTTAASYTNATGIVIDFSNMTEIDENYTVIKEKGHFHAEFYPSNREFGTDVNATNWTSTVSSAVVEQAYVSDDGNPAGSIKSTIGPGIDLVGTGNWTANFSYTRESAHPTVKALLSFDRKCAKVGTGDVINITIFIQKPTGTVVEIYNESITCASTWTSITDYNITTYNSTFNESGTYNLIISTSFNNSGSDDLVDERYDNVKLYIKDDFQPYIYDVVFNFTGVRDYINKTLCIDYKIVGEDAQLYIYNYTANAWNPRGNLTKGSFYFNGTIVISDDEYNNGNVSIRLTDQNQSTDTSQGFLRIHYMYVHVDQDVYRSCEYCHGINKHFDPATGIIINHTKIGTEEEYGFNGTNYVNQSITKSNGTWCASCHYQNYSSGDHTYDDMVKTFNAYGKPVPPEITGNDTYGNYTTAADGTDYVDHSPPFSTGFNDSDCFPCHAPSGIENTAGMTAWMHNVSIGNAGGPDCGSASCHGGNLTTDQKAINFTAVESGVHARLNENATNTTALTAGNVTKACWACHGNGSQPSMHPSNYKNPYTCEDCHVSGGSVFGAYKPTPAENPKVNVSEHLSSTYTITPELITNTTGSGDCEDCHSNDVNENSGDTMQGISTGKQVLANISHYGQNDSLMEPSINSTNCTYCHYPTSASVAQKWGDAIIIAGPDKNAPNKNHSTSEDENSECPTCHNSSQAVSLHDAVLNIGEGGPDCTSCHGLSGSTPLVNTTAINQSVHGGINTTSGTVYGDDEPCWACHGNGSEPSGHPTNYKNPWNCTDCHTNATGGLNATTNEGNFSAPAVYEHILTSGDLNTGVACEYCHNRSVINSNDSQIPNAKANVSHYGTKDSLKVGSSLTSTKDCFGCHRESSAQSAKWYATYLPNVGYGKKGTDSAWTCWVCHVGDLKKMAATMPTDFHEAKLVAPTWGCSNCH